MARVADIAAASAAALSSLTEGIINGRGTREDWYWYFEPPTWHDDGETITLETRANSDFWQKTSYGFIRDNGHFYGTYVNGEFDAVVKVTGGYEAEYDQAGLMVRVDDQNWMKCGVEFVEGVQYASAVVTNGRSDWSVAPLHESPPHLWIRVKRCLDSLEIGYSTAEEPREPGPGEKDPWTMLRVAPFMPVVAEPDVRVGIMACSPERAGFKARFEHFDVKSTSVEVIKKRQDASSAEAVARELNGHLD